MVKEYAFISFFRALAAFWVMAVHCMMWGGWWGIPLPPPRIAVDLFMMISGYLMAANAVARDGVEPLARPGSWMRFWLRRFFRIAPAYYLSLALAIVLSDGFLGGYRELQNLTPGRWDSLYVYDPLRIEYDPLNVLLHLTFLFGLHPTYSFSTFLPDWSLSLEMQFYFVFPALFLFMQKAGFTRSALCLGIPVFIAGYAVNAWVPYYEPSLLLFKLQYFLAGILVFRILSADSDPRSKAALIACAVFLVSVELEYGIWLPILPLLLIAMLLLGWLETRGRMPAWLSCVIGSRTVRFASDTSYGVYLFHGFFLSAAGLILASRAELLALSPPQHVLFIFLFVAPCAYLAGYAVYRWVEQPGIRLGRDVIRRKAPKV